MSKHTTFRIGGKADFFVSPKTIKEVKDVVVLCKREGMPYYVLGNGSNLLVGDKGYRGVMIHMQAHMNHIEVKGTNLIAGPGALLSKIAVKALSEDLTGFEFAEGIPGTIGGAVVMNAGAYGGEMKHVLHEVTVLTGEGEVKVLHHDELELGYRMSAVAKYSYIVLEATMQLEKGDHVAIEAKMKEFHQQRTTKQPLEYPSAGSTFKRPEGYFAGKLIDDAGLRGFCLGGAQVSEKHCGFVINKDQATAADVVALMDEVARRIKEKFGVTIEPEVKRLGEF